MVQISESISREANRVRLPDFTDPPLNEVILSIQFAALSNLRSVHFGLLWEKLRSQYPNVSEQAPIAPVFETFGIPSQQSSTFQIQTLLAPPLPRYWFERAGEPDLLQVQQDRIIHNWRQQADNSRVYPRYGSVKKSFEQEISLFQQWLSDESIGELHPNQCEVTYINIIAVPAEDDIHKYMEKITPLWSGIFTEKPPNTLERAAIQTVFLFSREEKPAGRLHVNFQPALRSTDGIRVIRLELTARGRPSGETVADALSFLDFERDQVVRTFAAVTTKEMHKLWGRTDGQH
jgi:uncharacterized protein (TIGR04255 family)